MKTLIYSILTLIMMFNACDRYYRECTSIYYENNSKDWVKFTLPDERYNWADFKPDTTMISYWGHIIHVDVVEYSSREMLSSVDTFEEWIPKGTEAFSMFVFKAGVHGDKLEELVENDEYFVRYDLTLDDIYSLCDNNGVLHVSYPPSPEMKHIRMWPPYEEVIENTEKTKF